MAKADYINALLLSAQKSLAKKDTRRAHQDCLKILELDAKHAEAHFLLGVNALQRNDIGRAKTLLAIAIRTDPQQIRYYLQLARCHALLHANVEAELALGKALQLPEPSAYDLDTIGVLFSKLGDHEKALNYFQNAATKAPDQIDFLYNLATSQRINGELDSAEQTLLRIIELQPDFYRAYSLIPELRKATGEKNLLTEIEQQLANQADDPIAHLHYCHAMAQEYAHLGDYHHSIQWLKLGNQRRKEEIDYHVTSDLDLFDHLRAVCNENYVQHKGHGYKPRENQPKPIFIIGLPRSGTTLLERILSNHSKVTSLGEPLDFPVTLKRLSKTPSERVFDRATIDAALTLDPYELGETYCRRLETYHAKTPYVVDKLPLNFFNLAFIQKALPEAKIICLLRNPMDVCLSNFKQLFAVKFSYYNYAFNIEDCANYIVAFHQLMAHWRDVLPAQNLLEIHYEDLVANTEAYSRIALNFIGLPFEQACLNFAQNQAPVATASAVQVRQPIYNTSVAAWQKYAADLEPARIIFERHGIH